MEIIILPASGQYFPHQLGLIYNLCSLNYKPDVTMGTSGGNMVAYLSTCCGWNEEKILDICNLLSPKFYCRSWLPEILNFIPSSIIGFFKGHSFRKSIILNDFFETTYNENVSKQEMWTGTYNCETNKFQLFCNKSKKDSLIDFKREKYPDNNMKPIYLNDNKEYLPSVYMASSSVPTVIPSINIKNVDYIDGGICCSSPGYYMSKTFENMSSFHIVYVNCIMYKKRKLKNKGNMLKVVNDNISEMLINFNHHDRKSIVKSLGDDINHKKYMKCSISKLKSILDSKTRCKKTIIEIFPRNDKTIDITKYTTKDVLGILNKTKHSFGCSIWWVGDKKFF